jgi:hypothetical protein
VPRDSKNSLENQEEGKSPKLIRFGCFLFYIIAALELMHAPGCFVDCSDGYKWWWNIDYVHRNFTITPERIIEFAAHVLLAIGFVIIANYAKTIARVYILGIVLFVINTLWTVGVFNHTFKLDFIELFYLWPNALILWWLIQGFKLRPADQFFRKKTE